MTHPDKKRLRRSMMFLNCQKPGLIKDPYIYGADSIMLDLEDAVAENQKDAARYSLFHALREIDYRGVERVVRINGNKVQHESEVLNQRDYPDIVRAELAALQKRITQLEERAHDFSRGGGEDNYE